MQDDIQFLEYLIYVVVEREFGRMILKPLGPSPLLSGCEEFGLIRGAP